MGDGPGRGSGEKETAQPAPQMARLATGKLDSGTIITRQG